MPDPHVLLVSQDADANTLYAEWFARTSQLRTSCAATLADARPLSASADVVLMDVTRDEHWNQCANLWEGQDMPPVVVLTGWVAADGRFRRRAFAAGCAAFIAKPCHPRVVVAVLHRVLNGERQIAIA